MANSYKLPSGQVIPTESDSQVRDAIRLAARARQDLGDSGGWDDPRLRAHLTTRAKAHGIPHIIPPDWKHEPAGKSAALTEIYKFDVSRVDAVRTPANGVGTLLMKSAADPAPARRTRSVTVEYDAAALAALGKASSLNAGLTDLIQQGRLGELQQDLARTAKAIAASVDEPLAKAAEYDRQAETITDRVTAEGYRQRARQARERVTTPAGFLAKAEEYERIAGQVSDPAIREDYRQLAKRARQEAGMA